MVFKSDVGKYMTLYPSIFKIKKTIVMQLEQRKRVEEIGYQLGHLNYGYETAPYEGFW